MENSQQTLPGWITEGEAKLLIGGKTTKLWKLRKTGQLAYSKIGNRTFYKLSSIQDLLEANTVKL